MPWERSARPHARGPALARALTDKLDSVRLAAAYALGEIGPDAAEAAPSLARALASDPDDDVRQEAAFALGELGEAARPMLPALQNAQRDRVEIVGQAAQEAIEKITDEDEDEPDVRPRATANPPVGRPAAGRPNPVRRAP